MTEEQSPSFMEEDENKTQPIREAPQTTQNDQAPQSAQSAQAPQSAQSAQAPQSAQSGQPPKNTQSGQAPQSVQSAQAPQSAQSGQAPQSIQARQAPRAQHSVRYSQSPGSSQSSQERKTRSKALSDSELEEAIELPLPPRKYLSTMPGIMRIIEFFLSTSVVAVFAYFCTFYDRKLDDAVAPVFLAMSREMFFFLSGYSSFIGNLHVILAVSCSPTSIRAVQGSIYFFLFDFTSFMMLVISSLATAQLYSEKTMPSINSGMDVKQGCCILGTVAGLVHLVGAAVDLVVFLRFRHHEQLERRRMCSP